MNMAKKFLLSTALWIGLLAAMTPAAFAQLKISSNPHYFKNGTTVIPLVGYSAEYLPHVTRPSKKNDLVTLESYQSFINEIKARGLNTLQLWVDLNHSIGVGVDGQMFPYAAEQPFVWDGFQWHLHEYDTAFFTNLKNVVAYAASKNVFVEVTLFDPWSGVVIEHPTYSTGLPWSSPWWDPNNIDGLHFTEVRFFVSFDNGTSDTNPDNLAARDAQVSLVQKIVAELNPYTNFYWQIANEPDFNYTRTEPDLDINAMIKWHNFIAQKIVDAEAPVGLNKHEIGVNFISQAAMAQVRSGALNPAVKIVNGHYVDVTDTPLRYGGITAARKYNSTSTPIDKLFGLNETRATPNPTDRMSARAEAWEHMIGEGGLYNNYALQWNMPDDRSKLCTDSSIGIPTQVRCDVGRLTSFLAPLNLAGMVRQAGPKPTWITNGVYDYNTADPISGTKSFWGAMQVTGSQYVFYYHHSNMSTAANGTRYLPVPGTYSRSFTFSLSGAQTGYYYKLEWFHYKPTSPNVQSITTDSLFWNGTAVTKNTPVYNYDLALRMTRCPTAGIPCS